VAGYEALADVYEWLIPNPKLTPAGSVAASADLVESLPRNARVLDCSCGTGQLAVGLGGIGLEVVASDASAGMVRRTQQLAAEHVRRSAVMIVAPVIACPVMRGARRQFSTRSRTPKPTKTTPVMRSSRCRTAGR